MSRTRLPNRRPSLNFRVKVISCSGRDFSVTVTAGVDEYDKIQEVFCADFKAGSDNQAFVQDACILLSRLLQHGDLLEDITGSMCEPPSLIGTIVRALLHAQNNPPDVTWLDEVLPPLESATEGGPV
jgi:hypothetical protein